MAVGLFSFKKIERFYTARIWGLSAALTRHWTQTKTMYQLHNSKKGVNLAFALQLKLKYIRDK